MVRTGRAFILLTGLPLLAGCGAESPPRLNDSGLRLEEPAPSLGKKEDLHGAMLKAAGRQTFAGPTAFRCVLHDEKGLQINFRTGDPELPAVAVRIEDFQGEGPYRARLFVTGRNRTGALVSSLGEAEVQVRKEAPANGNGALLLDGSFQGTYGGEAGKGSVQGRFGDCSYLLREDEAVPAESTTATGP
jgi:hypothetical protein